MSLYLLKASKWSQLSLRVVLVLFVALFAVYIFYVCMKQISGQRYREDIVFDTGKGRTHCGTSNVPPEDISKVHYPQPKTYSRAECSCTPVHFFVLLSLQRSGSGWFETLLNSHPNISSNGEIFSVQGRRNNISDIIRTLDTVYSLDWSSSAAKNDCVAAMGFKWMLNQGIMDHRREILKYFKLKRVSVIFLFRTNLLRRFISVLANDFDRRAKQLNGTHKSHVHSRQEAEILANYKPKINTAVLMSNLSHVERITAECLHFFNSTRHIIFYYEDIISKQNTLSRVQEFLRVPAKKLQSRQAKIHTRPLSEQVLNWEDVYKTLNATQYEHFLHHTHYVT